MRLRAIEIGAGLVFGFGAVIWPEPALGLKLGGFLLGVFLVTWGAVGALRDRRKNGSHRWIRDAQWHWNKRLLPWLPAITLGDAADVAWCETQGTNIAEAAENDEREGHGTVKRYYATALVGSRLRMTGNTPAAFKEEHITYLTVYGRRPPSLRFKVIPAREFAACSFSDDGNSITRYDDQNPRYIELRVIKSELKDRISEIKQW